MRHRPHRHHAHPRRPFLRGGRRFGLIGLLLGLLLLGCGCGSSVVFGVIRSHHR